MNSHHFTSRDGRGNTESVQSQAVTQRSSTELATHTSSEEFELNGFAIRTTSGPRLLNATPTRYFASLPSNSWRAQGYPYSLLYNIPLLQPIPATDPDFLPQFLLTGRPCRRKRGDESGRNRFVDLHNELKEDPWLVTWIIHFIPLVRLCHQFRPSI